MKASRSAAEGTVGLITYMRTDSTRVRPDAIARRAEYIGKKLGTQYLPATPNAYARARRKRRTRTKRFARRDAGLHAGVDSRGIFRDEQYRLYKLIWQRFVRVADDAGGLRPTTVEIEAKANADV